MGTTIGVAMATHTDYDGVYFTVQSLRVHHRPDEVLVVDNAPDTGEGQAIAKFCNGAGVRYIPMRDPKGTAAPRDRGMRELRTDVVVCVDSHVLLLPGALEAVRRHFEAEPESRDLVQGPLVLDSLTGEEYTHFADEWRAGMWGTWGSAFECPCGRTRCALRTSLDGAPCDVEWVDLFDPRKLVRGCELCGATVYPPGTWRSPDEQIKAAGWGKPKAPFEIPAQGLGAFACRREAWLGFNPDFRGFGGEEWYLHEKYRRAGARAICLPDFRWVHRFGYVRGHQYRLDHRERVRNYEIGHAELGLDPARMRSHFAPSGCNCGKGSKPQQAASNDWFDRALAVDPGLSVLRERARGMRSVVEISARRDAASLTLLTANPATLLSCTEDTRPEQELTRRTRAGTEVTARRGGLADAEPVDCDLLFVGVALGGAETAQALERWAGHARRIVLRRPDRRALVMWLRDRPEYTATVDRDGYVALTSVASEKKPVPGAASKLVTFARAAVRRAADGFGGIGDEELGARLDACAMCPSRNGGECGECGCVIERKASWPSERCPLGRWEP